MKGLKRSTLSIFLLLFAIIFLSPLPVLADTIGSIQTTNVGSFFDLSINISSVSDLYAFQFDIGIDPAILSATSLREGAFLPSVGTTTFIPGIIDNLSGSITFVADTFNGVIPGVTGSGTLVDVIFQAAGLGTSPIKLSNLILLDSTLSDITSFAISTTVSPVNPVPEPATIFLMSAGIAAIGIMRKRGREII